MNIETEKRVGKNIRFLRKRSHMTQEILSARLQVAGCDVTRSALAKIEAGQRHLYVDELIELQKILNVSFEEILKME